MFGPVRRLVAVLSVLLSLTAVAGCGLFGSDDGASSIADRPERARVRLGTLPIVDVAPVHIALQKGYFKAEGLDVELTGLQGGAAGIPLLSTGELDFSFGNYVSFIAAQTKGDAKLKLVADGFQAGPQTFVVVAPGDSSITEPADLAGRTVAVNSLGNVVELVTRSVLKANDIDPNKVTFRQMPFPEMQAALKSKQIDAAIMVEPFITGAERQIGAMPVLDAAAGPTATMPIAGYAVTEDFAAKNPKTVAAFRRALARAVQDATDRVEVETALTSYAKIDADTARLVRLGTYPTNIEFGRLARVVGLMVDNGLLTRTVDVSGMILPRTPGNS
jgi:NitT/TauT family transport system substrate-binding protein